MSQLVKYMVTKKVAVNAIKVSLVVGTTLNLINQGLDVYHGHAIIWWKVALNYAVPYLVASYSAAKMQVSSKN